LITSIEPGFELFFQVFEEGCFGISIVIVIVETLNVLLLGTGFAVVAVAWVISTDKVKGDAIASLESGPAPPTQASQILAGALGIVGDVSIGKHCSATPLAFCFDTGVNIVSCAGLVFGESFFVMKNGQQTMSLWDVDPVEATFLEHGHSDLVMFKEVAQLVTFVVVGLEGKVVHIEDKAVEDVAVYFASQAAIVRREMCCFGGGGSGEWLKSFSSE
jgi:hypothetical protein